MQIDDNVSDEQSIKKISQFTYSWPVAITPEYASEIKKLLKLSVMDESLLGFNDSSTEKEYDDFIASLQQDLNKGYCYLLDIRAGSEMAGMSILIPTKTSNCQHIVNITKGFIQNKYRGKKGVEGAFIAMVKKFFPLNKSLFVLDVRENSKAHILWKYFGFEEYGRLTQYSLINGQYHAGIYMQQSVINLMKRLGVMNV